MHTQLLNYIRAGYAGAWLHTSEETRAETLLRRVAQAIGEIPDQDPMPVFAWSFTRGYHGEGVRRRQESNSLEGQAKGRPDEALDLLNPTHAAPRIPDNALVILKDFHPYLENSGILRSLRDVLDRSKLTGTFVVLLSPVLSLQPEIEKALLVLNLPLPDSDEMGRILDALVTANSKLASQGDALYEIPRHALLDGLAGLTLTEAENVLSLTAIRHGTFNAAALKTIHREKAHVLKKNGLLRYKETDRTVQDIGGLDILKRWFRDRMAGFTPEARAAGLPYPKGVLLVGVQGCGKSLAAEAVATLYQVPLIEGNLGDVMGSLVGESERRMRELLATAEAIGRCVLRLDEFEKMASGLESSGRSDGGTTSRVLKDFLTWLNDRTSPVFVVATVNRIDSLPAEILRKGRFDEIFFVDLPTSEERTEIFRIHLRRQRLDPAMFALEDLVALTPGFSGAEIEQAIIAARYRAFAQHQGVTTSDLLDAIRQTKPLSVTMRDQITAVRERLQHVAVPASTPEGQAPEPPSARRLKT